MFGQDDNQNDDHGLFGPQDGPQSRQPRHDQAAPSNSFSAPSHNGHARSMSNDDLLDIKQEALNALTPLVGHLEQSAEEKFRTTMMMIQASDDQSLIKEAYAAAKQIQDEKARAQALLDVVNEINYFTQQHN